MVRSVTKDLVFDSLLLCEGKSREYKKAYVSGLISGINVQMALVKAGESKAYDGSLGAVLRINALESFETMKSGLSHLLQDLLTPDLFVNYDTLKTKEIETYLIGFGTGQIEVARKFSIMLGLGIVREVATTDMNFWSDTACDSLQQMF